MLHSWKKINTWCKETNGSTAVILEHAVLTHILSFYRFISTNQNSIHSFCKKWFNYKAKAQEIIPPSAYIFFPIQCCPPVETDTSPLTLDPDISFHLFQAYHQILQKNRRVLEIFEKKNTIHYNIIPESSYSFELSRECHLHL